MEIEEVKQKVEESKYKDWFNNLNLSINFVCVGLNKSFLGFVELFDFFQNQKKLWENTKDDEIGNMKESKGYFTHIHHELEKLLVTNPYMEQHEFLSSWHKILSRIQTKPDKYFTYDSREAEFLLDVYKNHLMSGYAALQFLRGERVDRPNNHDDLIGNNLAYDFKIKGINIFREDKSKKDVGSSSNDTKSANDELMLPKRQKQLVDRLFEFGFLQQDFVFTPFDNDNFQLQYKHKDQYNYVHRDKRIVFSPGNNHQLKTTLVSKGFSDGLRFLSVWLTEMKENLDIGNPWQEDPAMKDFFEDSEFNPYEEIMSEEEQYIFAERIDNLLGEFKQLRIDTTKISDDFNHLKKISSKVSKKDVALLLIGMIGSHIMTGLIPPQNIPSVWTLVANLLRGIRTLLLN